VTKTAFVTLGWLGLVSCGGAAQAPTAPSVEAVPASATVGTGPSAEAIASCVTARVQSRSACYPEVEDPDVRKKAGADCEKAARDGKLELVTRCSSQAADDTHEACQRALADCLAVGGGFTEP